MISTPATISQAAQPAVHPQFTWRRSARMARWALLLLIAWLGSNLGGLGQAAEAQAPGKQQQPTPKPAPAQRGQDPAFVPPADDPNLPHVLLIGDSISIGYTVATRELLAGKANLLRIPTNGGPTINGLANLDAWLGDKKWDVIHFNWGLHDLKQDAAGKRQVPLADYEKNLRQLVARLKKTGAKLIWCSTTPVPEGKVNPPRDPADVVAYNQAALKIMQEEQVAVDDLYSYALPKLKEIQLPVNVHFTPAGSKVLAKQVAESILQALGKTTSPK